MIESLLSLEILLTNINHKAISRIANVFIYTTLAGNETGIDLLGQIA
jgi:hypothetical protein